MAKIKMNVELGPLKLKNPVLTMSGTFGFGREFEHYYDLSILGGIVVKPATLKPRSGNPPPRIAETRGGILNAVGIQNPGIDAIITEELPTLQWLREQGTMVVGSVSGHSFEDYSKVTEKLSKSNLVDAIELNISCPNIKGGGLAFGTDPATVQKVVAGTRAVCNVPLIVKLSPNVTNITDIAISAVKGGADILSLINTLTGMAIDAKTRRPILQNITGGLSGPAVKPIALRMVYEVAQIVDIPIIGIGGIVSGIDAAEYLLAGATAVGVGTANILDPLAAPRIVGELETFLVREGVGAIKEIIGGLMTN